MMNNEKKQIRDKTLNECLLIAANNEFKIINRLIEVGADINCKDKDGEPAVSIAISNYNTNVAEVLIEEGADITYKDKNGEPLLHRVIHWHSIAKLLIKAGADVNEISDCGYTPLMIAIKCPYIKVAKFLLKKGADINLQNKSGNSALTLAVLMNNLKVVKFLLENGADVNLRDDIGRTVLDIAEHKNLINEDYIKIIDVLKEAGAK